jgi:hypothetical protein
MVSVEDEARPRRKKFDLRGVYLNGARAVAWLTATLPRRECSGGRSGSVLTSRLEAAEMRWLDIGPVDEVGGCSAL